MMTMWLFCDRFISHHFDTLFVETFARETNILEKYLRIKFPRTAILKRFCEVNFRKRKNVIIDLPNPMENILSGLFYASSYSTSQEIYSKPE